MADQVDVIEINSKKKILILAANPKTTDRLSFGEEVREIEECLQLAELSDKFELQSKLAVRIRDIRRALFRYKPHIVHFIGHGNKKGVTLQDNIGFPKFLSEKALSVLFKLCSSHVECVILSACYSASHADAINKHIKYVIGMRKEIEDEAAIEFALGFFDALGVGKSVEEAFESGCSAVDFPQELIPVLKKKDVLDKPDYETGNSKTKEVGLPTLVSQEKPGENVGEGKKVTSKVKSFEYLIPAFKKKEGLENQGSSTETFKDDGVVTQIHGSTKGIAIGKKKRILKLTLIITLVLLVIVSASSLYFLILKPGNHFGTPERVEIKDNILIAFDAKGKIWSKNFHSKIIRYAIADIDKDKKNDILVGFSTDGNESSSVIALDSKRNEKWRFSYPPSSHGVAGVKLGVTDMKMFDENHNRIIAVLLRDERWDLSVLVILDPKGKQLKELWYPGDMQQIEKIKNTYIIRAENNDLRQAKISKNLQGNFSVIFGLKYENIDGEAPPYLGMSEKKCHVEWYFFLSDPEVRFEELEVRGEIIFAQTGCGMRFLFNEHGRSGTVSPTDGDSCKGSLQLVKLGITKKENGKIDFSIPVSTPITRRPVERLTDPESNLRQELREQGILEKLREASRFCDAGNFYGENRALTLYREVIERLSPRMRQASTLLIEAEKDFENKNYIHALRKYKALFDQIPITPPPPTTIYFETIENEGGEGINFEVNGNKVCSSSSNWNYSTFWIRFRNPSFNWQEYDKICLNVAYRDSTRFDQSAMLKLQLNGRQLSPLNGKVILLGTPSVEVFLFQKPGTFYYQFDSINLSADTEIMITLNKGRWKNLCIELSLKKKSQR